MRSPPIDSSYPRDLIGYGENSPRVRWPSGAKVAVKIIDMLGEETVVVK